MLISFRVFGWGLTGHRVVGKIAESHLKRKARKNIEKLLVNESLVTVANWMDEIRSDRQYDHTHDWHWVTVPDSLTYAESPKNKNGDIVATLLRIIAELESGALDKEWEIRNVKMLVHLVGDIHQPLHVGTGKDAGGNYIKLKWFGKISNLHRVWDSGMIDGKRWSYSELAENIDHPTKEQIKKWQNDPIEVWIQEAIDLREFIYDLPENNNVSYEYQYKYWYLVERQLLKSGVRLAGILNKIYG